MGKVSIGGQAVIEGIMMKSTDKYAVAVRKPDKEIEVQINKYVAVSDKVKLLKLPILRGVFNFVESMVIGFKTLTYSAEFYDEEEDAAKKNEKKKEGSDSFFMFCTVALSIVLAVALFMLLPAFLVSFVDGIVKNHFLLGLLEGVVRLIIFLLYVVLISRMEDIKRTFMYHGAEHKTINCLESGEDLTVENIMKHTRFHKRCGTSFLFIVMIVSILVFMCIRTDTIWLRLLYRVLLVPVIAGISYEFIRFAGKSESRMADVLSKPGLWIQRLTTLEPTEDMVEVAIKSVEGVLDWRAYLAEEDNKNVAS